MLSSRAILSLTAFAAAAFAQSSTNLPLFIAANGNEEYAGSIVAADCSQTTIALVCTGGSYDLGVTSYPCDGSLTATATYDGSTGFEFASSLSTEGAQVAASITCSLDGTTSASCSASVSVSVQGTTVATSTVQQLTGSDVPYSQVPITAGASKLPAASTCTTSNAAPLATAGLYKVVIVPGAAALMAGAALL